MQRANEVCALIGHLSQRKHVNLRRIHRELSGEGGAPSKVDRFADILAASRERVAARRALEGPKNGS